MVRWSLFLTIACVVALTLTSWFVPVRAAAQDATPAADCPETTLEENKELVNRWFEILSGGNPDDLGALVSEDIVYHDPSPEEEPQTGGAEEWGQERQQDYPDLTVTVEYLVAEGDMVASYQRFKGTQQDTSEEELGHPATGLEVEWIGMVLFRIECGKIAEVWSVADELGRLQRLGVITAEELQSAEPVATPAP